MESGAEKMLHSISMNKQTDLKPNLEGGKTEGKCSTSDL
jgi:hypothetical protein